MAKASEVITPTSGGKVAAALIEDLAAASRILAAQGVVDGFGPVDATHMLVSDGARGLAFAEAMGQYDIVLMRAHGSVACSPTLQTAVIRAVYTEVNARVQHWASALAQGGDVAALSAEEGALADGLNQTAGLRVWDLWRSQVHF